MCKLHFPSGNCQAQGPLSRPLLVNSWLTPGQVYEMSREGPEIGSVMGWPTTHPPDNFFELKTAKYGKVIATHCIRFIDFLDDYFDI